MNLYDIYNHITAAADDDVTALHNFIVAEQTRRQATKNASVAVRDFMTYMESSKDHDTIAYELVNKYIDRDKLRTDIELLGVSSVKDYFLITPYLNDKATYDGISGRVCLIKIFREKSEKRLAESKHHIEKAFKMICEECASSEANACNKEKE